MNLLNFINQDTINDIHNYISLKNPPGLILQGIKGIGKQNAARFIAADLLKEQPELLSLNPDFFEIYDIKQIKVENITELLEICSRHSVGARKVLVVHNAHTISFATQNRLLKLLEDQADRNIIILLSEKDCLIDTIKSRCYSIHFHPYNESGMKTIFNQVSIEEKYWDYLCFLLQNAPYAINENLSILNEYMEQYEKIIKVSMREDLIPLFHVMKEKDNYEFFSSHEANPIWNVRLLLYPFYRMVKDHELQKESSETFPENLYSYEQAIQILQYGMEHLRLADNSYTKNDYFNLIRYIIQA